MALRLGLEIYNSFIPKALFRDGPLLRHELPAGWSGRAGADTDLS